MMIHRESYNAFCRTTLAPDSVRPPSYNADNSDGLIYECKRVQTQIMNMDTIRTKCSQQTSLLISHDISNKPETAQM